ncbi:hypothetical protein ACFSUS_16455 [Spirosoma soli]|uniref:Osmoprotectant transporter permease n=1 Tax=Spirosoma soli TaxID=1770529 RepID=A0ABW5M5G5_9BACT
MTLIRICWTINGFTLLLAIFFFLDGLRNATNSDYFNAWAVVLGGLALGLPVSYWLYQNGQSTLASVLAAIPAGFSVMMGLFFLLMAVVMLPGLISGEKFRWN